MITPEDREAGLPINALLQVQALGGALPEETQRGTKGKGRGTLTAQIERLGWKLLPIPYFHAAGRMWHNPDTGKRNAAFIDFAHAHEWLIVPPEDSPIRARKAGGKICAIREAYRLAMLGEDNAPGAPTQEEP
jgi:hypothetical protein